MHGLPVGTLLIAALALLGSAGTEVRAQAYPARPVRIVLGYAPGGGADALARLLASKLSETPGQSAFVENRTGASALLALSNVASSPPDGYSLLVMANSSIHAQALAAKPTFDIERDLAPISLVAIQPQVLLVNPQVPAQNIKEFIALAKARPDQISYGSSGVGGASHLSGELFNLLADVKLFHVPYKGGGESVVAAASGHIQATFASTTAGKTLAESGKLRALGVTSARRTQLFPSAPTIAESGVPGYEHIVWYGVMAPVALSADLASQVNALMVKMVNAPELKPRFINQGLEPQTGSVQQLKTMIREEFAQASKIIKAAGIKAE